MNTLKTIQTLSKIGKILSKIVFICCVVAFCGCIATIISLAFGAETLRIGGLTLKGIFQKSAETSIGTVYAAAATGLILSAGEAVLAKFAQIYFTNELADGTPFMLAGAKEMMRLGILTICIPAGTTLLTIIARAVIAEVCGEIADLRLDCGESIALGVMFLIASLLCRYGAETSRRTAAE